MTATVDLAVSKRLEGVRPVLHSDHGSQYRSRDYRCCLKRHGLKISMGRVRSCADNASPEIVFGQLKRELIQRRRFATRKEAAEKVDEYFLRIYNLLHRVPLARKAPEQNAQMEKN